jgi:hypothetical protein
MQRIASYSIHGVGCWVLLLWSLTAGTSASELFSEKSETSGLDFVHFNGMSGEYYFPEIMGAGGAVFDYDNDGDLDIYLVQGQMLGPGKTLADAVFPPHKGSSLTDRLYRNDLTISRDGVRRLKFTDVTTQSHIQSDGYGMGVTVGDYNNDGWVDLYITNFGSNQLYRNNADGTFTDVTAEAGVDDRHWSVSAAFFDFDRDGWLDLYVGNYVNFTLANHKPCYAKSSARDYCSPLAYSAVPDKLFRNRGDGTFEDVSARARIIREFGGALGVATADFDGDNWLDIYVANDGLPNQLWVNQRNGTFANNALIAGTAVNMEGVAEASMGVDAADFDGDGDVDIFMTHLLGETNTLYVNNGKGWFEDLSLTTGLATPSKRYTAFGTAWFDYNNDGWLDLFVANGEVRIIPALRRRGDPFPMHQPNQLFQNLGNGTFQEVSTQAGRVFKLSEVSRGAAFGDIDNDGDTDILVVNNSSPVRLLINEVGHKKPWLGLRLVERSGRDATGARVAVYRNDELPLWRRVHTDGSYASANDSRLLVGLGNAAHVKKIEVHWPNGAIETWRDLPVNRYTVLSQGQSKESQQD